MSPVRRLAWCGRELLLWLGMSAWWGWLQMARLGWFLHDQATRRVEWWRAWVHRRANEQDR